MTGAQALDALAAGGELRSIPALSAKQIDSIRQSRARINVWTGAIRSGKTVASLLRWVMYVRTAPRRGRLVMIGKTKDTVNRNLFAALTDPEIFGPIAAAVKYTPGSNVAYIFGREIDIIGANDVKAESKLRGLTCAGAYVDEATLLPRDFWTQLLGRMSVPGAMLFATTNPDNPAHWLRRDFLLRAAELDLRHWHFTLHDNPYLTESYKRSAATEFVGLWYKRFILGHWVAAEGAIYDMWDETRHVLRGPVPIVERWLAAGVDYGTSNPFAAVNIGLTAEHRPRLVVTSEYRYDSRARRRSKTDAEYSEALQAWLARHPIPGPPRIDHLTGARLPDLVGVTPEFICVDPSAKSFIVQLMHDGLTPTPARNNVLDGIRTNASLLARDLLVVHESCTALIAEIPGYAWDDKEAAKGHDVPIKADDHSVDALRYGVLTTAAMWRSYLHLETD